MLIKTTIEKIVSKEKREYKYFDAFLSGGFSKEKKGTEYIVNFLCTDGVTYTYNFKDGRKAETFYPGKEVWGMVRQKTDGIRLEYWWWTKEEFEKAVKTHILRAEESIKSSTESIAYLKTLA